MHCWRIYFVNIITINFVVFTVGPWSHGTGTQDRHKTIRFGGKRSEVQHLSQLCAIDRSQKAIRPGVVKIAIITSGHKNRNRWGEWMKVVGGRAKLPRLRNPNQSASRDHHSPAAVPGVLSVYLSSPTFDAVTVTLRLGYARSLWSQQRSPPRAVHCGSGAAALLCQYPWVMSL